MHRIQCSFHVLHLFFQDLVEYFEEIDLTFKDFLQVKASLFEIIKSPSLQSELSARFDRLYASFDNARGSCTQALYVRCLGLIDQLDQSLGYIQTELRGIGEALYSKSSSPHNLMEKLKVSLFDLLVCMSLWKSTKGQLFYQIYFV